MRTIALSTFVILIGCGTKTSGTSDTGSWWNDGSSDTTPSQGGGDGEYDEDDEEDDEDDEVGQFFWGEVSTSEGFGAVGFFSASSPGSIDCEEEYEASAFETVSDCSECSVAFALTLGEQEIFDGTEEGCAASPYGDLSGSVFKVGASGETLFIDAGSGWQQVEGGYAELEGEDFFFEIGGDEGDDDEDDEEEDDEDEDEE